MLVYFVSGAHAGRLEFCDSDLNSQSAISFGITIPASGKILVKFAEIKITINLND